MIVMWSGTLETIPRGWALCDGTNGTPDLTDRFILGAEASTDPGETGGTASHSHNIGVHNHTVASAGAHDHGDHIHFIPHTVGFRAGPGLPGFPAVAKVRPTTPSSSTPSLDHSHGTSPEGGVTNTRDHRPPFFRLAFIMRL